MQMKMFIAMVVMCLMCVSAGCSSTVTDDVRADVSSTVKTSGKPFPPGGRRITLDCGGGESASALGSYGGVNVNLSCSHGRASSTIIVPSGNVYDFFVGVETPCCAVDAHPTGDSEEFTYQYYGTVFSASTQ